MPTQSFEEFTYRLHVGLQIRAVDDDFVKVGCSLLQPCRALIGYIDEPAG